MMALRETGRTECAAVGRTLLLSAFVMAVAMPSVTARPGGPLQGPAPGPSTSPAPGSLERIAINDNRLAAGNVSGGVLSLQLEARSGHWFPDGDDSPGVVVKAFAVQGGPLQIPGPLIRVPEGTEIRAVVRNRLDETLAIHGLYSRPGRVQAADVVVIPPGETHEIAFQAVAPGTYYYWGATAAETPLIQRVSADTQLSGAIVVDPRGGAPASDRILVIGQWNNSAPQGDRERRIRYVINGRSWPHTERLSYSVASTVRMRVINVGAGVHPMHLHGFYFNVDSRGDEREDKTYPAGSSPRFVVTERTVPGSTFALTWKPTRPGNWLFHCHDNVHLDYGGALDGRPATPAAAHSHVENHALEMMAGPVMGITVTGASTEAPEPAGTRRRLRLVARIDAGSTDAEPAFGYTVDNGNTPTAPPPYLPGPTLLLKRGEPVSVTVVNELGEPTAVHWHGIELESYFDGVAGFAGEGRRIAPAIPAGGSFEARFTPPRSGTFIYHTHLDDTRQQRAGLTGPLLVVDSPESYDPEHDLVLMVTVPRKVADANKVLINGSLTPAAREFRLGQRYRLRFINVHTFRPSMRMRLLRGDTLLKWRSLAKDGMDLPNDQVVEGPSEIQMGNGETYDFWFVPSERGDLRLDVTAAGGMLLATLPIRVS
jgi:FtsP/CotA-like multicopper oxidase with cupredoxin domain